MQLRERGVWRRLAGGVVGLWVGVCGCRVGDEKPGIAGEHVGLLPNPAYQLLRHGEVIELVANAGREGEKRYRLDAASLALWDALNEAQPKGAVARPRGLPVEDAVARMQRRFPDRPREAVARDVRAFLAAAVAEGLIVPDDAPAPFQGPNGKRFIEYEPRKDGSKSE